MAFSSSRFEQFLEDKLLFGNRFTSELAAIMTVYFVQGILTLARLSVSFFLKDELGLTPATASALTGIAVLPWAIKPLYGLLSDGVAIAGYRRRPYLLLSGAIGAIAWLAMATVVQTPRGAVTAIFFTSLSVALSDVIIDSVVVQRARIESLARAGSLQSLAWAASSVGSLITAYLSGWLLEWLEPRQVFAIVATFPLLVSAVAWLIDETPASESALEVPKLGEQVRRLWQGVSQRAIVLPMAFIFLWHATPSAESAMFYFVTNELGFETEFLGRIRLATSVASLVGVWLFQRYLKTVPFRQIFAWGILLSSGLGMTSLLLVTHANRMLEIDDHWFSLGDSAVLAVIGRISFLPVLVLAARLCPAGIEATLFALLMAVFNLGGFTSQELGAVLTHWLHVTETEFDNLWLLVLLTNLSTLLPLPFLPWLPATDPQGEAIPPKPALKGEGVSSSMLAPEMAGATSGELADE